MTRGHSAFTAGRNAHDPSSANRKRCSVSPDFCPEFSSPISANAYCRRSFCTFHTAVRDERPLALHKRAWPSAFDPAASCEFPAGQDLRQQFLWANAQSANDPFDFPSERKAHQQTSPRPPTVPARLTARRYPLLGGHRCGAEPGGHPFPECPSPYRVT